MSDAWKINRGKQLSPDEMHQFEELRSAYKEKTGREMPKHSLSTKGMS